MFSLFRREKRRSATPKRKSMPLCLEQLEDRWVPALFQQGYVLLGLSTGIIEVHDPTLAAGSTLVATLDTGESQARGMAFDAAGNLYATTFTSSAGTNSVVVFDADGVLQAGEFGSGYNGRPESIVFDDLGNAYVGANNSDRIRKFDANGNVLNVFTVEDDNTGTDWTQLSPDFNTIVYTSESKHIHRVNATTGVQLGNITSNLPGSRAFALRFLPPDCDGDSGGILVADSQTIVQITETGQIVRQYDTSGVNTWFALNRDPDGATFWSANLRGQTVFRFNLNASSPIAQIDVAASLANGEGIVGIAVVGELFAFPSDSTPPRYVVASQSKNTSVSVFDPGSNTPAFQFDAFPGFKGGVRIATADVNSDGIADIVVGKGPGGNPQVKVFDGTDPNNVLFDFEAFASNYAGGVNVGAGDLNGDGFADIICGMARNGSEIRVFSGEDLSPLLAPFVAFSSTLPGGVNLAVGDLNDDHRPDIIAASGKGGEPRVRVFSGVDGSQLSGPLGDFLAFEATHKGGVSVAAGRLNDDCEMEIIVGTTGKGAPHIRAFDGATGSIIHDFLAGPEGFIFFPDGFRLRAGVHVGATDLNGDGVDDIITGFGKPGFPEVKAFSGVDLAILDDFFIFNKKFKGGLNVSGKVTVSK